MVKSASNDKSARLAVGTMLSRQHAAERSIRQAVAGPIGEVASKADRKQKATAALILLLAAKKKVAAAAAASIFQQRQLAREAARNRLHAELKALGVEPARHQWVARARHQDDVEAADAAAASLASQWHVIATGALLGADEKGLEPGAVIRATRIPIAVRTKRTAETEVARAYSDEHREALRDLVEHDRGFRDGALADAIERHVVRQWSAMVDACERCWPLDGQQAEIDGSFPGGEVPGEVHPRCRCIEFLTTVSGASAVPIEVSKEVEDAAGASEGEHAIAMVDELGLENAWYDREGMRPESLAGERKRYEGLSAAEVEKTARTLPRPVRVHIEPDEKGKPLVILNDGRHRVTAAKEAGAKKILAKVVTYDQEGNVLHDVTAPVNIRAPRGSR